MHGPRYTDKLECHFNVIRSCAGNPAMSPFTSVAPTKHVSVDPERDTRAAHTVKISTSTNHMQCAVCAEVSFSESKGDRVKEV